MSDQAGRSVLPDPLSEETGKRRHPIRGKFGRLGPDSSRAASESAPGGGSELLADTTEPRAADQDEDDRPVSEVLLKM